MVAKMAIPFSLRGIIRGPLSESVLVQNCFQIGLVFNKILKVFPFGCHDNQNPAWNGHF